MPRRPSRFIMFMLSILCFTLTGCGVGDLPIEELKRDLSHLPAYSVILNDMKEDGTFFKSYYHKYRVAYEGKGYTTPWEEVTKDYYYSHEPFLGMVIASKKENDFSDTPQPPGYQYVGNSRYGNWRNNSMGQQYWAFNRAGNALFDELDIDLKLSPKIFRKDYNDYKAAKSKRVPFFGSKREYGTSGSVTQKAVKSNFFERRMKKQKAASSSFAQKVNKRVGRTKTGFRSRSGSKGK